MMNEQSMFFPKQIKLDDYEPPIDNNLIRIMQTSNLLLGNGGKSSNASIIMSKALHFMQQEGTINLKGKQVLELGSGAGFLGIYLGCLGVNVLLTDLPPIKQTVEKNINLNKQILKAKVQFSTLNWKLKQTFEKQNKNQNQKQGQMEEAEGISTSSSDLSLLKTVDQIDYTIICEAGNIEDLMHQLRWIGKEGIIIGFQERDSRIFEDYLDSRCLQKYLLDNNYEYQKLQNYHPDYVDERVCIYRIWK